MADPGRQAAGIRHIIGGGDVLKRTGFRARSTLWRKVRAGEFPAPVDVGGGRVGWYEDEVVAWIAARPRVSWAPKGKAA